MKTSNFKMFFYKNCWNSGCSAKMYDCTVKLYLAFFKLSCKFCLFEDTLNSISKYYGLLVLSL